MQGLGHHIRDKVTIKDLTYLMVNGHGVMHPQGLGLASHVGVLLEIPTIGVAKRLIGGIYIKQSTNIDHPNEQVRLIKLKIEYWVPFLGEDM